jgi:hypothetical protein
MALLFNNLFSGSKPQNGELTINLNLTIKIEADGSLSVTPTVGATETKPVPAPEAAKPEEKTDHLIPDFDFDFGDNKLIEFGKNV